MKTDLTTRYGTITTDLDAIRPDGVKFSRDEMTDAAKRYRHCNRIHKPMLLLMWTDCKNGNRSNWEN